MRDRDGHVLAYFYFEEEPGRRSATDLLTPPSWLNVKRGRRSRLPARRCLLNRRSSTIFFFREPVLARSLCSFSEPSLRTAIRKSLSCLPSFNALVSHRGFSPRPVHVSPSGPRYFGATFLRISLPPIPFRPPPPVNRSTSFSRFSARVLRMTAISSRSLHRASFERVVREEFFGCMSLPPQKETR